MSEQPFVGTAGPVLITGAGGGIGSHVSERLLAAGNRNLLFHYRTRADAIAAILRRYELDPANVLFQADLTDEEQVRSLQERITAMHGPLYGLVNVAGASTNNMSWKLSRQEFDDVLAANLTTTFLTCREFIPQMRERRLGRIINISSVTAFTGTVGAAHYCAAKAAIVGLSLAMARELAPRNIAVSAIALGYFGYGLIDSVPPQMQDRIRADIPAGRFGNAEEAAGLIAYLLSEAGAYSGGQVYHLNGGLYR